MLSTQEFIQKTFEGISPKELIEIRELPTNKQSYYTLNKIAGLKIDPKINTYFGVYTRYKKQGTAEATRQSFNIWLDFDKVEGETLEQVKTRAEKSLKNIGLDTYTFLVNSGNGYHFYWKLEQGTRKDLQPILSKLAELTGADPKAVDKARIMRLPGSQNNKDPKHPKECKIIEYTGNKYPIELFEKITNISIKKVSYKLFETNKKCIEKMLLGVEQGKRNFSLLRIIAEMQLLGIDRVEAYKLALQWNDRNKPKLDKTEFNTNFKLCWNNLHLGKYKATCRPKEEQNQKKLALFCESETCLYHTSKGNISFETEEPIIKLNNKYLERSKLIEYSGQELLVLCYLKDVYQEYREARTVQEILGAFKISRPTLQKYLDSFMKKGYIKSFKRGKNLHYEYNNTNDFGLGYTAITRIALYQSLDFKVSPNAFKLYVLLCKIAGKQRETYISRETIFKECGISPANASNLIAELEGAKYILKRQNRDAKGVIHNFYDIL
jgi:DNA-binding MarR family transcriptional regulator